MLALLLQSYSDAYVERLLAERNAGLQLLEVLFLVGLTVLVFGLGGWVGQQLERAKQGRRDDPAKHAKQAS